MRPLVLALAVLASTAHADFRKGRRNNPTARTPVFIFSNDCTGEALVGPAGQTVTVARNSAAVCRKANGTLVTLTANQPRVNANGLLVEPAATNLLRYSEDQAQAVNGGWQLQNITRAQATAPDGTNTAWTITDDTTNGQHRFWQARTVVDGATYTNSLYAKAGTANFLRIASGAAASTAIFNLSTGAVVSETNGTGRIEALANGWYRVSLTFPAVGTTEYHTINMGTTSGQADGGYAGTGSTILIAFSQLEAGSIATSYVKSAADTPGARAADVVSIAKPDATTDGAGCLAATVVMPAVITAGATVLSFTDGGRPIYINSNTTARFYDGTNTLTATTTSMVSRSTTLRAGWAVEAGVVQADGVVATGTYDTGIVGANIYLGSLAGSTNFLGGYINAIKVGSGKDGCQ